MFFGKKKGFLRGGGGGSVGVYSHCLIKIRVAAAVEKGSKRECALAPLTVQRSTLNSAPSSNCGDEGIERERERERYVWRPAIYYCDDVIKE